jgi:beta-barrel assembly-enhancing protease
MRAICQSVAIAASFLLGVTACATVDVPSLNEAPTAVKTTRDEQQLWATADALEKRLLEGDALRKDPELDAYVQSVADRLLATSPNPGEFKLRLRVLNGTQANAFVFPNGAAFITTGLLSRLENESQMAAVLGHELTHFLNRHGLKEHRTSVNRQLRNLFMGTLVIGLTGGLMPPQAVDLWSISTTDGYSRELEFEADSVGLVMLTAAGYPANAAIRALEHLRDAPEEQQSEEKSQLGSHPRLVDRVANVRELIAESGDLPAPTQPADPSAYATSIDGLLLDTARLHLDAGNYQLGEQTVARYLERHPDNARAHFLEGELLRRGRPGRVGEDEALRAYLLAAASPDPPPETFKEIGLIHRSHGRMAEARAAFESYLRAKPDAVDAPIIRSYFRADASY